MAIFQVNLGSRCLVKQRMMEVVVTAGAISRAKLQSNHHHRKTNIQFLQAGCPSCRPPHSVKALKGKISHPMDLLTPNSPGGLPTLYMTTNSSWLPWERFALPLISPLMPVPQVMIICLSDLFFSSMQNVRLEYAQLLLDIYSGHGLFS